ncbi:MAG: c-type cytochrome [Acidobacteriota bacterium]|nr:c-type cytochrome [Acidobacteriota bacterium]
MRKQDLMRSVWTLSVAVIIWVAGTQPAPAQFSQNKADTIHLDTSNYPPDIQKGYGLFRVKCNECHGLDMGLNNDMSPEQLTVMVKRMRAKPSSRMSDEDAKYIADFLIYDGAHRTPKPKQTASVPVSADVSAGRAFYSAHSCNGCHSIGGQGGSVGPPLDAVGTRLSREQLLQRMQGRRAGAVMPPLPSDTTDQQINQLVDFLLTLKSK